MLEVGEEQLLVLLLVVQAQLQQLADLRPVVVRRILDQLVHGAVDMAAVGVDLAYRRPRQQPAFGTWVALADGLVIRVEEVVETRVEFAVAGVERFEQKGLEEPGSVGQMPLGRADVGHRLHDVVLDLERTADLLGDRPDALEPVQRRVTINRIPPLR